MKHFSALSRLILLGLIIGAPLSRAQTVQTIAEREVARRQAQAPHGEQAITRAQSELRRKEFAQAHEDFRLALTYVSDSKATGRSYERAMEGFCESGVRLAEQRMAEGKYAEAEAILTENLSNRYSPRCKEAATLLAHLRDPGYINKTMGPKFLAKVEEVKRLLTEAEGFYQSGRYDLAMKRYDQVLKLDPYNTAARRGQERIDHTKYRYGEEAYNETRGRAMWQIEHGWEQPVRQYGQTVGPVVEALQRDATGTARINNKLNSIIIPKIEFRDASIREAIDFIRQQAAANDPSPEGRRGVDIVLRLRSIGRSNEPVPVTGTTTAGEAVASPAPAGALPPGESAPPPAARVGAGPTGTGKDTQESTGGQLLVNREGAREFLESQGVPFPPGASAHFLPQSSRLVVRNTVDNLELVDALVEQANVAGPKQVEIESKFIEITQNNLKELGFDWLLGPFNIGNHKVFGSGGTTGTVTGPGVSQTSPDFPFQSPTTGVPIGQFPVTAGNRSGG